MKLQRHHIGCGSIPLARPRLRRHVLVLRGQAGPLSKIFGAEEGDPDVLDSLDSDLGDGPMGPVPTYPTIDQFARNTPLVRLQRLIPNKSNVILCKLEGTNPASSVKDRAAFSLIAQAEAQGRIKPGDTLIEATSGNTGIALAMAAAIKGYTLRLIMPENMTEERKQSMAAYGAELITVPAGRMEVARDLAKEMEARGEGVVLDQFGNQANPLAHYTGTGPEIWRDTHGRVTHFVSSMGTTGTIMGVSRYLKEKNPAVQIVGLQPAPGAAIAGIRRWPPEYLPTIFDARRVDRVLDISQREAEETMRALARTEGIFAGVSSGGAVSAALRLSAEVDNAVIVVIICDRGDRYLSSGGFSVEAGSQDPKPCPLGEFPSAAARLGAYRGPHYVLFHHGEPLSTGPKGAQALSTPSTDASTLVIVEEARAAVKAKGGTLLEVAVGSEQDWLQGISDPSSAICRHSVSSHLMDGAPTSASRGEEAARPALPVLVRWDPSLDRSGGQSRREGYVAAVAAIKLGPLEQSDTHTAADRVRQFVEAA